MPITELDQVLSALATKMDQSRDHLDAKIDDVSENLCNIVNLEFDTLNKRVIHITGKMDDQMGTLNGRVVDITNKIDDAMAICDRRATATNGLVAAGVRVLIQRSDFTDGRLNHVEDQLMRRLAQMEVKMDMQTEELQKFKMAVILMGGMLWFNVLTLVLITWTFVFWSLGFIKGLAAIIPPVHGVTDRSDVQIIQDGFVYMSKSVGNWLVMNILKEVRDEAHF